MNYKKYLVSIVIFVFTSCCAQESLTHKLFDDDVADKTERVRQDFEDLYYRFAEAGHFPLLYNNNLIIDTALEQNVAEEATILLKLVEWLENQSDQHSQLLLKKLNKLCNLYFLDFICSMNLQDKAGDTLLKNFQYLYKVKRTINGKAVKPFRTLLCKAFLLITIINDKIVNYQGKKKAMAYVLDEIEKRMYVANEDLGNEKIKNSRIESFVHALKTYAAREPLVQDRTFYIVLAVVIMVAIIVIVIYWKFPELWDSLVTKLAKFAGDIRKKVFSPFIEDAVDVMLDRLARKDYKPNEKLRVIGKQLGGGMGEGFQESLKVDGLADATKKFTETFVDTTKEKFGVKDKSLPEITHDAAKRGIDGVKESFGAQGKDIDRICHDAAKSAADGAKDSAKDAAKAPFVKAGELAVAAYDKVKGLFGAGQPPQ